MDPTAELQHEIREAAHEVAGIIGFAMTVGRKLPEEDRLWGECLENRLRTLHASLSRSDDYDELRERGRELGHALRVKEGWKG